MKLAPRPAFLTVELLDDSSHLSVAVTPTLKAIIRNWKPSTRVSPIFALEGPGVSSIRGMFKGKGYLVFLGPIQPEKVNEWNLSDSKVWLTLGLFNVIVLTTNATEKNRLVRWAKKREMAVEIWNLEHQIVQQISVVAAKGTGEIPAWQTELAKLFNSTITDQLSQTVKDYCPLMATTLSRSAQLPGTIVSDLLATHTYVIETLDDFANDGNASPYPTLGELLTVQAGLTRFSSQTFAGTGKISDRECHIRSHSLFGIGVPNIALANLRKFLESTLSRLPDRVLALASVTENVPDLFSRADDDPVWTKDHLAALDVPMESSMPNVPLLSYFSARDGYKSTQTTISAPLNAIGGCNTVQWSLLTVTHEYSHVLIRTIMSELYPDFDSEQDVIEAIELLEGQAKVKNMVEGIRRLLLHSLVLMDRDALPKHEDMKISTDMLSAMYDQHYRESQEILVHAFDFMYFYGSELDKYVEAIWTSWGTVPNINSRVKEYVIRTICTALVNNLRRTKAEEMARDQVIRSLQKLEKRSDAGSYVKRALSYIDQYWDDEIFKRVFVRRDLVKIARAFLYSEMIASTVRRETKYKSEPSKKGGYDLRPGHFESKEIDNPINFLEEYTISSTPSVWYSTWMFYILAFCTRSDGN